MGERGRKPPRRLRLRPDVRRPGRSRPGQSLQSAASPLKKTGLVFSALLLLLSACATDPEEREVRFPAGDTNPCERPDPRPLLRTDPGRVAASFRRRGPGRAVESARLLGGVFLLIQHESCNRSSQTLRVSLPKTEVLPDGAAAVYARAAAVLEAAAPSGAAGAPLRELSAVLSLQAAKGAAAAPLGARLPMGEFQELLVTRQQAAETSAYGAVIVVLYRIKV